MFYYIIQLYLKSINENAHLDLIFIIRVFNKKKDTRPNISINKYKNNFRKHIY